MELRIAVQNSIKGTWEKILQAELPEYCLLYTSDAADERSSVDLGGRRIIKKKKRIALRWREVTKHKHREQQSERG